MYKSIIFAIITIFFLFGVISFCIIVLFLLTRPDKNAKYIIVCPFTLRDEYCVERIKFIKNLLCVTGFYSRCKIIAMDCGMSEKEKLKVCDFANTNERIDVISDSSEA